MLVGERLNCRRLGNYNLVTRFHSLLVRLSRRSRKPRHVFLQLSGATLSSPSQTGSYFHKCGSLEVDVCPLSLASTAYIHRFLCNRGKPGHMSSQPFNTTLFCRRKPGHTFITLLYYRCCKPQVLHDLRVRFIVVTTLDTPAPSFVLWISIYCSKRVTRISVAVRFKPSSLRQKITMVSTAVL